jgi:hypothetical protein
MNGREASFPARQAHMPMASGQRIAYALTEANGVTRNLG